MVAYHHAIGCCGHVDAKGGPRIQPVYACVFAGRFALARDPYSLPVMVAWGLMEESLGDIGRARQLFEIAATTEPSNPNIWEVIIVCFAIQAWDCLSQGG